MRFFLAHIARRGGLLGLAVALALGGSAVAQQLPRPSHRSDSSRLNGRPHRLAEVQVRAVRPAQFAVGTRQMTIDSAALSQFRGGTVAEALQARTPLYLKNYGPGQLATIALRGTSAQHTAVLWNGLNIMLPTLGLNDFSLLPVGANTQLTVQPGPAAALYGSGAIGGAVLLNTEPDWRPGIRGSVQGDGGSFGLRGGNLAASSATATVAVRLAASSRTARNDYPYFVPELGGPVRHTLTSATLHHQWSLAPEVAWRLGAAGQLTATAWLTETDRDIQAAVDATDRHARELDQSRRYVLAYRHLASARAQWTVRGAWFEDVLNYRDDGVVSNSRVQTTQGQAEYTVAVGQRNTLRLGAEAQHFRAFLSEYVRPEVAENRGAAFALWRYVPRPALRLSANLRQAALPGATPFTPAAGLEWDVRAAPADSGRPPAPARLTLKASAARSYRAPTLNERYWVTGNPDLRPETGLGYELGAVLRRPAGAATTWQTELTAYRQLVSDWVQWTPGPQGWSPRNLRQVLAQGLEASTQLTGRWGRHCWTTRAAYHFTEARTYRATALDPVPVGQPLPYVPTHGLAGSADWMWRGWQLSATATYTSFRYTDATARSFLPGYGLLNASFGYARPLPGGLRALVLAQASNLLDHAYDSYEARPAPPRALLVSLRLQWR